MHTYTHTYIHTYIHTCIGIYIHTYTDASSIYVVLLHLRNQQSPLESDESIAVVCLVIALTLQMAFLAQWGMVVYGKAVMSMHTYVGRCKLLIPTLAESEEAFAQPVLANPLGNSPVSWALEGVCVGNSGGAPAALVNVNLSVAAGERLLVLGRRGSGVETLPLLLFRAVKLNHGRVLFGGKDAADLPVQSIRDYVKYVARKPVMFQGTVLDNLWQPTNVHSSAKDLPKADVLTVLKFVSLVPRQATSWENHFDLQVCTTFSAGMYLLYYELSEALESAGAS
jgi:ABC-type transport system involved in cytochrome bd biosynthesis fused ATPase/permease subunit